MGGAKRNPGYQSPMTASPEGAQESKRMMPAADPPVTPARTGPCSPRSTRFPPRPPRMVAHRCSAASSVLSRCPTPRRRARGTCGHCLLPPDCRFRDRRRTRSPGYRAKRFRACLGLPTAPGPKQTRDGVCVGVAFRIRALRRRPKRVLSRLNPRPARTPVNASPTASRPPTHDSGSEWFAIPFLCGSCIRSFPPVHPGARSGPYSPDTFSPTPSRQSNILESPGDAANRQQLPVVDKG